MKRTNRLTNVTVIALFIAMLCYIGVYISNAVSNRLITAAAVSTTVREYALASGIVVRDEETQESKYAFVDVTAAEGIRISRGEPIAVSYANESGLERAGRIRQLELEITGIRTLLGSLSSAEDLAGRDKAVKGALLSLSSVVSRHDLKKLDETALRMRSLVFESEEAVVSQEDLFALEDELVELKNSSRVEIADIPAPEPGVFSTLLDGYEHLSPLNFESLTPETLRDMMQERRAVPDTAIGKLITSLTWYYVSLVSEDDIQNLELGHYVNLEFGRYYSSPIRAQIMQISEPLDGECAVVFSCNSGLVETLAVRQASAEVVYGEHSGIRIPAEALRADDIAEGEVIDLDNKKNPPKTYVYALTGAQAEKKYVDVAYEGDGFLLVYPESDADALRDGNEIIVSGKNLYDGKIVR